MEPVTTAILAALTAGAELGAKTVARKLVVDGYGALKALLKRKLGAGSEAIEAVEKLEEDPDSAGWKETVGKELAQTEAVNDPEIVANAEALLERIKEMPGGDQHIIAVGKYIAIARDHSTATVNVGVPHRDD